MDTCRSSKTFFRKKTWKGKFHKVWFLKAWQSLLTELLRPINCGSIFRRLVEKEGVETVRALRRAENEELVRV